MKNLATIQKVLNVESIEGADKIEVATVLGWKVVVKKDEYKIGDLCTYIGIDTVMPEKPEYEFLSKNKYRIKTIKLRQQISQGLIIPAIKGYKEGDDVTDVIGVKKYEKIDNNPAVYEKPRMPKVWYKKWIYLFKYNILYTTFPFLRKKTRSPFPTHLVSITDETRIQNIPDALNHYKGKIFYVSEKLDGSSITIVHQKVFGKSKYRICSRRFELHDKNNDWYKVFESTNFQQYIQKLVKHFKTNDIIVQGEAIGRFNGNHHNLKQDEIRLFNVYVNGKRLLPLEFWRTSNLLDLPICPFYKTETLNYTMDEILRMSQINDSLNPKVPMEGLVWRCVDDGFSFKVINNDYLLKHE